MRAAPGRIVSLVPSLTESLFVLGLGGRLVGVTEWCVHPADAVAKLPKQGGDAVDDPALQAEEGVELVGPGELVGPQQVLAGRVVQAPGQGHQALVHPLQGGGDLQGARGLGALPEAGPVGQAREGADGRHALLQGLHLPVGQLQGRAGGGALGR